MLIDTQTGVGCPTPVFGYRTTRQLLLFVIFYFFELGINHIILRLGLLLTSVTLGMSLMLCLLLSNQIGETSLSKSLKALMPLLLISIVVLLLITYVDPLTTWLPSLLKK